MYVCTYAYVHKCANIFHMAAFIGSCFYSYDVLWSKKKDNNNKKNNNNKNNNNDNSKNENVHINSNTKIINVNINIDSKNILKQEEKKPSGFSFHKMFLIGKINEIFLEFVYFHTRMSIVLQLQRKQARKNG